MDYIDIGPNPCDEECVQVGDPDYNRKARIECKAFIEAIRKKLGPEPMGARLAIKSNPHDFGTYHEVVCYFDDQGAEYAYKCEGESPATWAEVGMKNPLEEGLWQSDSRIQ